MFADAWVAMHAEAMHSRPMPKVASHVRHDPPWCKCADPACDARWYSPGDGPPTETCFACDGPGVRTAVQPMLQSPMDTRARSEYDPDPTSWTQPLP